MNIHVWSCSYTLRMSCQSQLQFFIPVPFLLRNMISMFILTVKILWDYHPWGTFMTPFQTPWIGIEQRAREWWRESVRERVGGKRNEGVATASTTSPRISCIFMSIIYIWAVRESVEKWKKNQTQNKTHAACLFYMCKLLRAWGVGNSMAVLPDWASKHHRKEKKSADWQTNPLNSKTEIILN